MDQITAFLEADELDVAMTAARGVDPGAPGVRKRVAATLIAWDDRQGVANLLMFPDVMSPHDRVDAIQRALGEDDPYLRLAGAAGFARLGDALDAAAESAITALLLGTLESRTPDPASQQSSAVLDRVTSHLEADRVTALLDHPDELVRHNLLVALIGIVGAARFVGYLDEVDVPAGAATAVAAAREEVAAWFIDGELDAAAMLLSDLGTPLLPFIPNLKDLGPAS